MEMLRHYKIFAIELQLMQVTAHYTDMDYTHTIQHMTIVTEHHIAKRLDQVRELLDYRFSFHSAELEPGVKYRILSHKEFEINSFTMNFQI